MPPDDPSLDDLPRPPAAPPTAAPADAADFNTLRSGPAAARGSSRATRMRRIRRDLAVLQVKTVAQAVAIALPVGVAGWGLCRAAAALDGGVWGGPRGFDAALWAMAVGMAAARLNMGFLVSLPTGGWKAFWKFVAVGFPVGLVLDFGAFFVPVAVVPSLARFVALPLLAISSVVHIFVGYGLLCSRSSGKIWKELMPDADDPLKEFISKTFLGLVFPFGYFFAAFAVEMSSQSSYRICADLVGAVLLALVVNSPTWKLGDAFWRHEMGLFKMCFTMQVLVTLKTIRFGLPDTTTPDFWVSFICQVIVERLIPRLSTPVLQLLARKLSARFRFLRRVAPGPSTVHPAPPPPPPVSKRTSHPGTRPPSRQSRPAALNDRGTRDHTVTFADTYLSGTLDAAPAAPRHDESRGAKHAAGRNDHAFCSYASTVAAAWAGGRDGGDARRVAAVAGLCFVAEVGVECGMVWGEGILGMPVGRAPLWSVGRVGGFVAFVVPLFLVIYAGKNDVFGMSSEG
ncbi:hypothetical protein HDU96_007652 [Phlyctochytrium bullatum]|nr:hypothetical protein HDU96_007652 [Phlyctochytrium bullatum]